MNFFKCFSRPLTTSAETPVAAIRILALGDSLTAGFSLRGTRHDPYTDKLGELLQGQGLSVSIDNHGEDGDTTDGMLFRLSQLLKTTKEVGGPGYTHMILLGGTNDLGGRDPKNVIKNLARIHGLAREHSMKTFAVTLPEHAQDKRIEWLPVEREEINDFLRNEYAETLVDLAREHPQHSLSDADLALYWDDGLHFTAKGYERMGEIIFANIKDKL